MASLAVHSRGADVLALQRRLLAAGFSPGPLDGIFGRRTRAAVLKFQRSQGIEPVGRAGPKTNAALGAVLGRDTFEAAGAGKRRGAAPNSNSARPAPGASPGPVRQGGVQDSQLEPWRPSNRTASFERVFGASQRNQMATGRITVNGRTYAFRTGGQGRGSLPAGVYVVRPHLWSRDDKTMSVGGVGYSFALSDKHDPRVRDVRRALRIHPDGGSPGTEGCIGIVGEASVQRQFREDMRAEFERSGGAFLLSVR